MPTYTAAQIAQLAPDAASNKAAAALGANKWPLLEKQGDALWGHCQGSGKNPYQTAVDLSAEPAFKCSCPSRKFPCKHGLALLLRYAESPERFQEAAPPDWVTAWLEKRQQTRAAKAERADKPEKAPDPAAQEKRRQARHAKAADGLADLQRWLEDQLRNGLAQRGEHYQQLHHLARRMNDAQLPGIAARLQHAASLPATAHETLLAAYTTLYLLADTYTRYDRLDPDWQAEITARLGIPVAKETVLQNPPQRDHWHNIGSHRLDLDRGEAHCHWLYGSHSGRYAYILEFRIPGAPPQAAPVLPGTAYDGELCYYPGIAPQRAQPREWQALLTLPPLPDGDHTLAALTARLQAAQRDNPFRSMTPGRLDNIRLYRLGDDYALGDDTGHLPLVHPGDETAALLAHTGGNPFTAFIRYDHLDRCCHLLATYTHGSYRYYHQP